ncbi:hypothetical protein [Hymenobacter sp. GOD-10R]|uniref:hypothetical protein n=1 Tax=Hymenobacter sp. GOD-10R TaxID=3093922 RepID=UPI002D7679DD|nr:hypothetical protein [Hymenobacter sp. GOD-10R]WRQ30514.1 hypothetical protein SD425_09605 [Hymenobacter sp. GOD-10R]
MTFERWYLGDGTYPPLHNGQKVNLSFYVSTNDLKIDNTQLCYFKQLYNSDYSFCGQIIRNYQDEDSQLVIIDTSTVKFYIELPIQEFKAVVGQFVSGTGQLLVDYYMWVENLENYQNPPNLFYNFIVDKIREVIVPEKYIIRADRSISYPSSLSAKDYSENDIVEVESMDNNSENISFYLLDLKEIAEDVPRTFY